MEEIWKPINGFEKYYQVSNFGRVRGLSRLVKCLNGSRLAPGKILKNSLHNKGYLEVFLSREGKTTQILVHRLVAIQFIPNSENKPGVNHKDGNKLNNYVDNLEWNTSKENNNHATRTGLSPIVKNWDRLSLPVVQLSPMNEFIKEWPSLREVTRNLGFNRGNLSRCANGQIQLAYGFKWKYKRDLKCYQNT